MAETQGERIATLEAKEKAIEQRLTDIDKKLDDIISLKNKGLGAFWLASALVGTGIAAFVANLIDWFKGVVN